MHVYKIFYKSLKNPKFIKNYQLRPYLLLLTSFVLTFAYLGWFEFIWVDFDDYLFILIKRFGKDALDFFGVYVNCIKRSFYKKISF